MRYERRDPRQEDLRQIDELKSMVDSQEKDISYLTGQLRELQLHQQMQTLQNQQNANQSKKSKGKNNKNGLTNNRNIINTNENSNNNNNNSNDTQQQMRHQNGPQQPQMPQNANHERDQQQQPRMKPPPLIKTVIYEEENEEELYEQQIRDERENAKKIHEQEAECELQHQQDGVMVELVPESPDYATKAKHMNLEEISEAHIVSNHEIMNNIPDVVCFPTPSTGDKLQEIRIEVISTIEPANIQIVPSDGYECNRNDSLDLELD